MNTNQLLDRVLNQIADDLDIPKEIARQATSEYLRLAQWLEGRDQVKGRREPKIYSQGSFRIGTTIRPLEGDYDIDFVYERDLRKTSITQEELKRQAGEHLKSYVDYLTESEKRTPTLADEGRRCWTLDFQDQFHMDILPAIPDDEDRKNNDLSETAICITDRSESEWKCSDPAGYAEWFKGRMRVVYDRRKRELAEIQLLNDQKPLTEELIKASAENIPEYDIKTPLQKAIQILKRHRDFYFREDYDNRPASIILTTLAANAYKNEDELVATLVNLVRDMPSHIKVRSESGQQVSWVQNPTHESENFADRWQDKDHPDRESKFRSWLQQVAYDINLAIQTGNVHKLVDILGPSLGSSTVSAALESQGFGVVSPSRSLTEDILALTDTKHVQAPIWPSNLQYLSSVKGSVYEREYGTRKLRDLKKRPISKGMGIRFQLETNTPPPYEVYWQIVNTGSDARADGKLRGEFTKGGDNIHWETATYSGRHWIEAFVIKNNVCVARSKQLIVRVKT